MISVVQLGRLACADGLRLQQRLVELRKAERIGDVLLLLEHLPVITLGRNAKAANVLASTEQLAARGVEVFECDRGGDVTFHGPGQVVGYPIFDLRGYSHQPPAVSHQENGSRLSALGSRENQEAGSIRKSLGAVDYVRRLEEVLIRTCAEFGIQAKRVAGMTGVWTEMAISNRGHIQDASDETQGPSTRAASLHSGALARDDKGNATESGGAPPGMTGFAKHDEGKIAAIGVHISRAVTSHGFALNVNTDLSYFNLIVPCGITAKPVTSMQKELGREIEMDRVAQSLARTFGSVFGQEMRWVETIEALLGESVGVPMRVPDELRRLRGEDDLIAT